MSGADSIWERHGITASLYNSGGETTVSETRGGVIKIEIGGSSHELTPAEARYIARKLMRLARRCDEKRLAEKANQARLAIALRAKVPA